jgi:hypothetical protein
MTTEFERFKYHEGNEVVVEVLGCVSSSIGGSPAGRLGFELFRDSRRTERV